MTRCPSHRIMIGELLIGSALIVGAIIWLLHWEHLPLNVCMLVLLGIMRALLMIIRPLFMSTMIGLGMLEPGMVWNYMPNSTPSLTGWTWGLMMMLGSVHMLASWVVLVIGILVLIRTPNGSPANVTMNARLELTLSA